MTAAYYPGRVARPSKITEEQLLDAALAVVHRDGATATTADIAAQAGVRVGSLYYRFPNREVLLLSLWVRSIQRFQANFLAAIQAAEGAEAALVAAAVSIPRYCRRHLDEARALTLFRHLEVLAKLDANAPELTECPAALVAQLRGLNDHIIQIMAQLTIERFGTMAAFELVRLSVHETSYGLVRPYLRPGAPPMPEWLDDVVAAMVSAALKVWHGPAGAEENR